MLFSLNNPKETRVFHLICLCRVGIRTYSVFFLPNILLSVLTSWFCIPTLEVKLDAKIQIWSWFRLLKTKDISGLKRHLQINSFRTSDMSIVFSKEIRLPNTVPTNKLKLQVALKYLQLRERINTIKGVIITLIRIA